MRVAIRRAVAAAWWVGVVIGWWGYWQGGMEGVQTLCSHEAAKVRTRTSAVCEPLVSSRLRVRLQFPDLRTEGEGGCIAAR